MTNRPPMPSPDITMPRRTRLHRDWIFPLKRAMVAAIDAPWSPWTTLEQHVVMCGFPRSGTTLAQLMAQCCVADLKCFPGEVRALDAARYMLRNHRVMLSKQPADLFVIPEIRAHYRHRRAQLKIILFTRDPRSVLTSMHARKPGEYYVSPRRWRAIDDHFQWTVAQQDDDVLVVSYEDLVQDPDATAARMANFTGWRQHRPFSEFHTVQYHKFNTSALNGVRPVDPQNIHRWREPQHHQRLRELIELMPELPQRLIDMGYEKNANWTQMLEEPQGRSSAA